MIDPQVGLAMAAVVALAQSRDPLHE